MTDQSDPSEDDVSLDEIQSGIFNLVVGMHMMYSQTMPEDQARLLTATYLKSLIDGLLLKKEEQEEETNT